MIKGNVFFDTNILQEAFEMEVKTRALIQEKASITGYELNNLQRLKFEEANRILSLGTIQKICSKYQLRFLDFQLFKGNIPVSVLEEIRTIEQKYNVPLNVLRLIAPKRYFALTDDARNETIILAKIEEGNYLFIQ